MGYRLLGVLVWRAARWYLRRRYPDAPRKIALAGVAVAVLAGGAAAVVQRQRSSE